LITPIITGAEGKAIFGDQQGMTDLAGPAKEGKAAAEMNIRAALRP
jgi:pyruvate/2-oxoglutarate dehydrogenase complex dihydrolipoamide acyltransferase (E2) component